MVSGSVPVWAATSTSGTVDTGAAGYLAFYPSNGTTVNDTDSLYFDDTNNRLGIGTTSPSSILQLAGLSKPQLLLTDTGAGTDLKHFYASSTAGALAFGELNDSLTTYTERLRIDGSGNVGIGTTSPSQLLSVHGNTLISGDMSVANFTATGTTRLNGVTYNWPSSDGSANYVLSTNSSGVLSWKLDATGGGGGASAWSTTTNDMII